MGLSSSPSELSCDVARRLAEVGRMGNCRRRRVGAIVLDARGVLCTGANGTAPGLLSCARGGCVRCANDDRFAHAMSDDLCTCLHAESAAVAEAARRGVAIAEATLVCSYQPCIMCARLVVAAGLYAVRYLEPWRVPERESGLPGLVAEYERLLACLPLGCRPVSRSDAGLLAPLRSPAEAM